MILEVPGSISAPDAITGIIARLIAVFLGQGSFNGTHFWGESNLMQLLWLIAVILKDFPLKNTLFELAI